MPTQQRLSDRLLQLPLFMGLGKTDLDDIMGYTKFGFEKVVGGKIVVETGDICDKMYILTSGNIMVTTHSDDHSYVFQETVKSPHLFQAERLFGMNQRFTHTYETVDTCHFITLSKEETMKLLENFLVFRLNFYNMMSSQMQKMAHANWRQAPKDLRGKIIRFFTSHCLYPAGYKDIKIKMVALANEVNDSRLDVSRELNKMQDEGLITLSRGMIHIPSLEKLIM